VIAGSWLAAAVRRLILGTSAAALGVAALLIGSAPAGAAGTPAYLVLTPAGATIVAGGSQGYTAEAYDSANNDLGDVTAQTAFYVDSILGSACAGNVCTVTSAGPHHVIGEWDTAAGSSPLQVNRAAASSLVVTPTSITMTADGNATMTTTASDPYGNSYGDVTAQTTFTIAPDGSCSGRFCGSTVAGPHTITAAYAGLSATATASITPASPATVTLSPSSVTLAAGASQAFTATAVDSYGNGYGDLTNQTTFYLNSIFGPKCAGNVCTVTSAGRYEAVGDFQNTMGVSWLTVNPGPPTSLALAAPASTLTAGSTVTLTTTASDQYSNTWDATAQTTFAISPDGSCSGRFCGSTVAGPHTITASYAGLSASVAISMMPAAPASVTLSPASATITAGGSQAYAATAVDSYGNSYGDVSKATLFYLNSTQGTQCGGNTCGPTSAGTYQVIGQFDGVAGSSSLTVNPGPLSALVITPASLTLPVGNTGYLTVAGYDAYGNAVPISPATWSVSLGTDGTVSPTSGRSTTFTASSSQSGSGSVAAAVSGFSTSIVVSVLPAAPTRLEATVYQKRVSLTWQGSRTDVAFKVYRSTNGSAWVLAASGISTNSFTDTSVSKGATYSYYVTAVGSTGLESYGSGPVSVTT